MLNQDDVKTAIDIINRHQKWRTCRDFPCDCDPENPAHISWANKVLIELAENYLSKLQKESDDN